MESIEKIIKKNKLLILIILIGAFLRFYRLPAYVEFLGDQGRDVLQVRDFLVNRDLMFIGPRTSIGDMYLGPWYYYLMAPFLLVANYNPLGPVVMVILFSLATVYLLFEIGNKWFNKKAGIIAAGLGAVSPVLIKFSTFSWNPNIMPFFSLLSIWLTYRIWQKKEYKKMIWLAVSLAMVLNSHYLGLLLFPPIGLFLILTFLKSKKENKLNHFLKFGVLGIGIFSILMSPLLIFDLKHDWMNFNAFKTFFTKRQTTVNFKFYKGFSDLPKILKQLNSQLILSKDQGIIVYASVLFIGLSLWLGRRKKSIWLLGITLVVGFLGLANYKQHIYAHYYGFLYPVITLLIAYIFSKLKHIGWLLFLVTFGLMLFSWHGWQKPIYQLRRARKVSEFIINESGNQPFGLALLAEQNYDDCYEYFIRRRKAKMVNLHQTMPEQLFVICEPWGKINCDPIGHEKWEIATFGWAEIEDQWEKQGVKIYQLVHYKDEV